MRYIYTRQYYSAVRKKKGIMKFASKWMEIENHPEAGNPDPERQTCYVLTYKWTLAVKDNHASIHRPREVRYSFHVKFFRKNLLMSSVFP